MGKEVTFQPGDSESSEALNSLSKPNGALHDQYAQLTGNSLRHGSSEGPAFVTANSSPTLDQQETAFAKEHHLKLSSNAGTLKYSMQYDGSDHLLFETSADQAGLVSARDKLKILVDAEENNISSEFKVQFAPAGEVVTNQKETADTADLPHRVLSRDFELFELEGIKSALQKSSPSNIALDGKTGVKFYALTEKPILELNSLATFQNDKEAKPSVYLWPQFRGIDIATEKDRPEQARKFAFTDGRRPESVEGATIHELGHHQFMKLGLDPQNSADKVASASKQAKVFEKMGWLPRSDEKNADYNWLLQGKSKDADGKLATFLPSYSGLSFNFDRWSQTNGPTDALGEKVPADKMQVLSEDQMISEAKVKPPTSYFEIPEEEYAEAVRMFRMSDESRLALKTNSPDLYALMKESDQKELDLLYGKNKDGSSKMVRSDDGTIIASINLDIASD